MSRTTQALAVLPLLLAGLAAAHDPSPNADCSSIQDESLGLPGVGHAAVTLPDAVPELGGATLYVFVGSEAVDVPGVGSAPAVQVWEESNGFPGLQTHAHTCRTSPDHVSHTYGADDRLA